MGIEGEVRTSSKFTMKWSLQSIFGGAQITVHLNPLYQTETIYCTSVDVDWWYGSWDTEHHLFHSAF